VSDEAAARDARDPLLAAGASQFAGFSLVRDDAAFRLQRRLGLIPAHGLGIVRRAVFWSLLAWLPIAVWAVTTGRATSAGANEPLLAHFGIHARFLLAVPLFVIGEGVLHARMQHLLPQFLTSGIVPQERMPELRAAVESVARLRDATLPWVVIVALVLSGLTLADVVHHAHEVDWAVETGAKTTLGFGGWWFLYVGRPIFLTLLLAWLWRLVLLFVLMRRIGRLELCLVPTHPDRAGGLGFLATFPGALAPVVFAISAVVAARLAHEVVYHDVTVRSMQLQMGLFVVAAVALFLLPALPLVGPLARTKRRALREYGALVAQHDRLVHERWIEGREVREEALLAAPELGPVADVAALYGSVREMRTIPLTKAAVAPLVLAAVLPMLAVLSIQVPVRDLLKTLLTTLL
jgi:hypothetical protein